MELSCCQFQSRIAYMVTPPQNWVVQINTRKGMRPSVLYIDTATEKVTGYNLF